MNKKHWFRLDEDIVSAFNNDDYDKLKRLSADLLNFINDVGASNKRVREKIYNVYDKLEADVPGLVSKLIGITTGSWVVDDRINRVNNLVYRYIIYDCVYNRYPGDNERILRNYETYCDGAKILAINNGLNEDEKNSDLNPVYTYDLFTWYEIEKLFIPFFKFVLSTTNYTDFKHRILDEYIRHGERVMVGFNSDLAQPLLAKKPVDLPPEWEQRYRDLIKQ